MRARGLQTSCRPRALTRRPIYRLFMQPSTSWSFLVVTLQQGSDVRRRPHTQTIRYPLQRHRGLAPQTRGDSNLLLLLRRPWRSCAAQPKASSSSCGKGPCAPGAARSHFGGFGVPTPPQTGSSPSSSGGFFPSKGAPGAFPSPATGSAVAWDWPTTGAAIPSASGVHPVCI